MDAVATQFNAADAQTAALANDVVQSEQELRQLIAKGSDGKSAEEFQRILDEKRSALVEKNLALIEKKDRLASLKDELVSINKDLKTANNRYIELIDKIDKYYLNIKAEISSRNYVDQKMFSDLLVDYAKKTKELETLKGTSPTGTGAATPAETEQKRFSELMTNYEASARELNGLGTSIAKRDEDLTNYKAPLTSQNEKLISIDQSIAEKNKELANLRAQVAYANRAADRVDVQAKTIQTLLKESDGDMAGLSASVSRIKTFIHDQQELSDKKSDSITTLATTSTDKITRVRALEQKVAELEAAQEMPPIPAQAPVVAAAADPALVKAQQDIASLKATIDEKDRTSASLQEKLTTTEKKMTELEVRLNAKDEGILTLEERIAAKASGSPSRFGPPCRC
jgi:chromosome segregation ATPase